MKHIVATATETNIIPETIPKTEDLEVDFMRQADLGVGWSMFISVIYVVIVYRNTCWETKSF